MTAAKVLQLNLYGSATFPCARRRGCGKCGGKCRCGADLIVLGYRCWVVKKEGGHDSVNVYFLPVLRLWVCDVFPAVDCCSGAQQAGPPGDFPAQHFLGMERDRMDRRPGWGGKKRCSRDGEVTSAP